MRLSVLFVFVLLTIQAVFALEKSGGDNTGSTSFSPDTYQDASGAVNGEIVLALNDTEKKADQNYGSKISTTAGIKSKESPDLSKPIVDGRTPVDNSGDPEQQSLRKGKEPVTILLGRAINASPGREDQWVSAILETAFEYKLAAIKDFILINSDTIRNVVPVHSDFSKIPEDSDYLTAGKKMNAEYVVIQKFEVARNKNVFFYMEIMSVKTREVVSTVERTFKLKKLGTEVNEIISILLREFNVTPPRELARFLRMPVVGDKIRVNKNLGECIVRDRFSKAVDSIELAADYRSICEKERDLPIAYYRAGFFFSALGKYSDAAEAFNLLFLSVPEYTPVYIPLARAFRKSKRPQDAVRIASMGEKRGISESELISEKALAFLAMGKPDEAEAVYKKILAKNSNDPYALVFYARFRNDQKRPKDALVYINKLLKVKKLLGKAYLEMGRSLLLLNRNNDAVNSLTKSIDLLPNEIEPLLFLGDAYLAAKQYQKAFELFENALQKNGDNIDLYLKAAFAADKAGNKDKALSILKGVEQRFSNHGGLQKEMGLLELSNGDSANARIHLEASMRAGIEDERVITGLGWIYVNAGEYAKAEVMFNKALKTVKDKNRCKVGLAMVYIKKGNTRKAVRLINEVTAANVSIPGLNSMLGDAMAAKGEKENALVYYRKERSLSSSDKILQQKIASLSFELEPASIARKEYQQLLKKDVRSAQILYRLGVLSLKLKDATSAKKYLSEAAQLGDTDAATWLEIGKGYAAVGLKTKALDAYERCTKKSPSNEDAWLAIASLQAAARNDSATAEAYLKLYTINSDKYSKKLAEAGTLFEKSGQTVKAKSTYAMFIRNKHEDANVSIRLAMMEFIDKKHNKVISLLQPVPAITLGVKYGKVLVESYFAMKKYEKALPLINFVLSKAPKDVQTLEWAAIANDSTRQFPEAIKMYKKYLLYAGKNQEYAYHLGELLELTGKKKGAISQYKRNIRAYPSDARNYNRLAAIYVEAKNWKPAITMLEKSLSSEAASPKILGLLAKANIALGRKKAAMKHLKDYIKNSPKDSSAWYELGMLYYNSKQYINAAKALVRAGQLMRHPSPEINKLIGSSYMASGDTVQATGYLESAHSRDKTDSAVVSMLLVCYRSANDSRKLLGLLYDQLKLDPENDGIRLELAELYLSESRYSDATKLLEDALRKRQCDVPLHLKLAAVYEKQKDQKQWLWHLQAASKCNPKDAEMLFQIGRYYFEQENKLQAERYLKKALRINKKLSSANYMLGSILLARGAYKSAGVFLSRAVAIDRKNIDYRVALAEAFYKQNRFEDAFKVIRSVVRAEKVRPDALRMAGLLYKAMGNPDTARQILERAIQVDRKCSECFVALGDLYFDEGDYTNAADRYKRALDMIGFSKDAALRLALCYLKMDRQDNARSLYEKVIDKHPGEGEALFRLISIYLSKNMVGSARTVLSRNGYNKNGWYYLSQAVIKEADNNINAAMIAYARALKRIPHVTEVQAGCGRISLAKKKYSAAIKYFGQAMAGDPTNIDLMFGMARAYSGIKDQATALDLYNEIARQRPDYPHIHFYMARSYSQMKDYEMAIQMLEQGARYDKKNYQLFYVLGRTYQRMGNSRAAIENYLRAIKINERKSIEAFRYIGNIYYKESNEKKAKKYYATYIKLGGKNKKIKRYMNRR